jgi:hypothetical protein
MENKMDEKQAQFDWGFGLLWVVLCAIGVAIGGMLAFTSMWSVGEAVSDAAGDVAGGLVAGGLFGAFVALGANVGPGLLLQRKGISAFRWISHSIVAGAVGTAVGLAVALGLLETLPDLAGPIFIGLTLGLPVGLGQWRLLRRQGLAANEWPLISTAAFLLAFLVGFPLGGEGREWLSIGAISLLLGTTTGLGMMWLLRRQTAVQSISAT